jgi:chromosome segregation ATPase
MDKEIKKIQLDIDELLISIRNADDDKDDIYDLERNIKKFNANYDEIEDRFSKLKEDLEDQPDYKKPLIGKLNSIEQDMKTCKEKLTEKENLLINKKKKDQFYNGELEGVERIKTERNILLENQKKVDHHGLIINSIQENVKEAGVNLNNINAELDYQGQKMDRIQEKVIETEEEVKKTSKEMHKLERRDSCAKALTLIAIILFGLFDLALIGVLVYNLIKK